LAVGTFVVLYVRRQPWPTGNCGKSGSATSTVNGADLAMLRTALFAALFASTRDAYPPPSGTSPGGQYTGNVHATPQELATVVVVPSGRRFVASVVGTPFVATTTLASDTRW